MIFTPLMYLKAGVAALILALFLWGAFVVRGWHNDSLRLTAAEAQAKQDVAEARGQVAALQAAYKRSQEASSAYQKELAGIAARPVVSGPVRLCVGSNVPRKTPATGGPGSTVPASGVVSGPDGTDPGLRAGRDIGPALRKLAKRADGVSAQGRAIQGVASPSQ